VLRREDGSPPVRRFANPPVCVARPLSGALLLLALQGWPRGLPAAASLGFADGLGAGGGRGDDGLFAVSRRRARIFAGWRCNDAPAVRAVAPTRRRPSARPRLPRPEARCR
jgi:hypothetical protein